MFNFFMVVAIIIVEMMGKPDKFVRESLEKHIKSLDSYTEVEIRSAKISDPKEVEVPEDQEKPKDPMFTCFAEIEFEVPTFERLTSVVFDFMPSSVEVVEPITFDLDATEVTDLLNNLSGRLHRYDDVAKLAHARIGYLESQLKGTQEAALKESAQDIKKEEKSKKSNSKKSKKKKD